MARVPALHPDVAVLDVAVDPTVMVSSCVVNCDVSHLLAKLGMSSRTQIAVLATEVRDQRHPTR